jgi:recombinational DNA repair protein RecR
MRNWINLGSKNARKIMCFLLNQRKKTLISVQDLEYAERLLKICRKIIKLSKRRGNRRFTLYSSSKRKAVLIIICRENGK